MNTKVIVSYGEETDSRWIYRLGAISALLVLIGYIATFPVYAWVGNPPKTGIDSQLVYFAGHATGWWIIAGLMVGTDLLLIPVFLALNQALKSLGKHLMVIALALAFLFVAFDISVTWTAFSTLLVNGGKYMVATDAAKAALVAGASYASAITDSPLSGVCAIGIPATAVLLTSLVMLRGVFNKTTAYLGLAMGVTGLVFPISYLVESLSVLQYINALFATAWYGFVCAGLFRLGRQG